MWSRPGGEPTGAALSRGQATLGLSVGEWVALGVVRFVLLVGIVRRCLHFADIGFASVRVGGVRRRARPWRP